MILALVLSVAVGLLAVLGVVLLARRRERQLLGALLEQVRREAEHPLPYRRDQRVRAIQQRLTRVWGKRALAPAMKRRIEVALGLDA